MILSTEYAWLLWDTPQWLFFLLFCNFCTSLTSPWLQEYISLVCASAQLLSLVSLLRTKEGAGKGRAADGSREGAEHSKSWTKTDGDKLVALKRHVQCDFQFRDISVNALGNFEGLSRSQSLLMLQTYGRNLKKVSSQNAMCLHLMHWMNVQWNIIIKMLPLLWTLLRFEEAL